MRYPTAQQREQLERTVLALALYGRDQWHVAGTDGSVTVTGAPLRGEVRLFSCYTPAFWYASCQACSWISISHENAHDPALTALAEAHRCADARKDRR